MSEQRRELAVEVAWQLHGTPYLWGGDDPSGWDCSGSTQEVLKSVGTSPRNLDLTADGMMRYYEERGCLCEAEEVAAGDVVFFHKP